MGNLCGELTSLVFYLYIYNAGLDTKFNISYIFFAKSVDYKVSVTR